ncbi:hypothetical protein AB1Y20_009215 [Prymnesium parvum]|uniref:Uncharacterized protein n=1 Tax=Prymnesium parvum TaxID=97485 RepID=A0AB34K0Y4_PRYPA
MGDNPLMLKRRVPACARTTARHRPAVCIGSYPLVRYGANWRKEVAKVTGMMEVDREWEDAQAQQMADVIAQGFAPRLARLHLDHNRIGDAGVGALAAAHVCVFDGCSGKSPEMVAITLEGNPCSVAALEELRQAIESLRTAG